MSARQLPATPDLRQLMHQAKDLLIDAAVHGDFDSLRALAAKHPDVLLNGNGRAGWNDPMAAAASVGLRRVIETLQAHGARLELASR